MEKTHRHEFNAACGVNLYERKRQKDGMYFMRGLSMEPMEVGDKFFSHTNRRVTMVCVEVISSSEDGHFEGIFDNLDKGEPLLNI